MLLQGKLLAAVNNKVMLYKMSTTAGGRQELVSDCSPVGVQVLCLHLAVRCVWVICVFGGEVISPHLYLALLHSRSGGVFMCHPTHLERASGRA